MTDREKLTNIVCNVIQNECVGHCNHPPCIGVEKIVDALIANGVTVQQWRDAKTDPPKSGEHVLVCCEVKRMDGSAGSRYVCDGFYAAKHTENASTCGDGYAFEYSEADDEWYLLEGWYEVVKNWGDYNCVAVSDFVVGWMPLPEPQKRESHADAT